MKSHAILRTNVGLTTNVKLVVGSTYSLYCDAIISNTELSSTKYRKMQFNKNNYWDEIVPYFFRDTPYDIAFHIKYDNDSDNMYTDFSNQYDDLYQYGARNIIENKDYSEEYEYFAPLYIYKNNLPTNFIIFRIDGPGLTTINKDNFKEEIIKKLKCVKIFDLTRNSPLGEWLDTNITKNKSYPVGPVYMDFRKLEFSSFFGIDYEDGGYSEKSFLLESTLQYEQTFHDFEKFVFDNFKNNKLVFPHIINFSFLFDDTPASPTSIRKWSLNRYLGFYLDSLEFVKYVAPYTLPSLKPDVIIDQYNLLYSQSEIYPFNEILPDDKIIYVEIAGDFYKLEKFLEFQTTSTQPVQVSPNSFVEESVTPTLTKYKIISNIRLAGRQSELNQNLVSISSSLGVNSLKFYDGTVFNIENFDDADVWMIEIGGVYHNIIKTDGEYYINSDYAFEQSLDKFDYYLNDPDPNYRKSISLIVDAENDIKKFGIYKLKFSDIKDFDLDIIDTQFSKHEYIKKDQLTFTDETKMYSVNQQSNSFPKTFDDFKINGKVVNIPASSEYTANGETFQILDDELTTLWRKNAERVKWGYQNSISSNDYPYLLNNSFAAEDFNRTTNPYDSVPSRVERNLDYFLTIDPESNDFTHHSLHVIDDQEITFLDIVTFSSTRIKITGISSPGSFGARDQIQIIQNDGYTNADYNTYSFVESMIFENGGYSIIAKVIPSGPNDSPVGGKLVNTARSCFNVEKYLNYFNYDQDYFSYFFGKRMSFDSGSDVVNSKKWSYFNTGDNYTPNTTLFRGLKFNLYDVDGIKITDGKIDAINIKSNNNYDGYKFSILLSKNNFTVRSSESNLNTGQLTFRGGTSLVPKIIEEWKHDKLYAKDDWVLFNNTLYECKVTTSQITDPNIFPYNSSDWAIEGTITIFWSPTIDGSANSGAKNNLFTVPSNSAFGGTNGDFPPLVYNEGEYYYSSCASGCNFWNPNTTYNQDDTILYKNKIWKANKPTSQPPVTGNSYLDENSNITQYWSESPDSLSLWTVVSLWDSTKDYNLSSSWSGNFVFGHYVIYEDIVYLTTSQTTQIGVIPPLDPNWKRFYSMVPDTNYSYTTGIAKNSIIFMNNRFYYIASQGSLENGICIYINKKYKNVLVNIFIDDNTYIKYIISDGAAQTVSDEISRTNRDDLYNDMFSKLTAQNFMSSLNDLTNKYGFSDLVKYVIVNEDSSLNIYDFNNLNSIGSLPVLLTCEGPDELLTYIKSNEVEPVSLSKSEIKIKRQLDDGDINSLSQLNHFSDKNLGVKIKKKTTEPLKIPNYSGLENEIYNRLYRHSGYYSPIFNDIPLFKAPSLTQSFGNYLFDTELTAFGQIRERIVSKVNRSQNILKLKNNPDKKSVYPMVDEFGYHVVDFFIFKSTWDYEYHYECVEVPQVEPAIANKSLIFKLPQTGSNSSNNKLL